jgi:hypothetical protein
VVGKVLPCRQVIKKARFVLDDHHLQSGKRETMRNPIADQVRSISRIPVENLVHVGNVL